MRKFIFILMLVHFAANSSAQCISGDCKNGLSVFVWPNGDKFEGQYLDGIRTGKGHYWWASGDQYLGDWSDNQATGFGKIKFGAGGYYVGQVNGGVCGEVGYYIDANGNIDTGRGFGSYPGIGCYYGDCRNGHATHQQV